MLGLTDALSARVHAVLDRRLKHRSDAPLSVGLSGGGDSVALTLIAADWARRHGRRLILLTVDHGLNPQSAAWTAACGTLAARLGLRFQALRWDGEKPAQGLPAAARAARHRLLAQAAREAGASVVLLGHTASDLSEAATMRAAGSTTPSPREWSPSPAWPDGRGVFLLRPMLGIERAALRAWLAERGQDWIEDPANEDMRFARARARAAGLKQAAEAAEAPSQAVAQFAAAARVDAAGVITLPGAPLPDRLIAAACLCAAGTGRPPRRDRSARLAELARTGAPFVATLAGARVEGGARAVCFMREPGEIGRGGQGRLRLFPGRGAVWDGRFEFLATRPMIIAPLAGHAARLDPAARQALRAVPAGTRGALPVVIEGNEVACPVLSPVAGLDVRLLAADRLRAAAGLVRSEP